MPLMINSLRAGLCAQLAHSNSLDYALACALADAYQAGLAESKVGAGTTAPAPDAFPQAHRLALELEALLLACTDTAATAKWWDSAHEALEQWRQFCAEGTRS